MDFKKIFDKFRFRPSSNQTDQKGSEEEKLKEIERKVEIDWQQIIGFGNFSVVYVGFFDDSTDPVAVKVPRASDNSNSGNNTYENVLKEVSIMETIGKHENVIDILGVHSICESFVGTQPTFGIITPLCVNGSLQKYLRSKPIDITIVGIGDDDSTLESKQGGLVSSSCMSVMSFSELLKFSYEIAQGMSYISSKNVVQGDLAARNVLLNVNKTCKISDFGMSKKLGKEDDSLSNDVEQQEIPTGTERRTLAWRWMAIECLEGSDITIFSDVWAYGVTLWEIFTIGDAPFPRHSWDSEFIEKLKSGAHRLHKPKYANSEIYKKLMECWNPICEDRPSFSYLTDFFFKLLSSSGEKMQPLKCKESNSEQLLLQIRQRKTSCVEKESALKSQGLKHKVSLRHWKTYNPHEDNAFLGKYVIKTEEFTNYQCYMTPVYFDEMNGERVCVTKYQVRENSKRAMNLIKAMAIVGDHPNVVKFIGMFYDENLKSGTKYLNIVTEYLNRKALKGFFSNESQDYNDVSIYSNRNTIFRMVCKFASEIARGMEFISSKQIVQGDVSSKMIFLDANLTCKIRLSNMCKRIYEDEIYIKTTPDFVSWRILSIESLKRLEFSTKSDCWAYGILVWETFSLGKIPYEGTHYSAEFPELLTSGFRLPAPKIGGVEIHSMLLKCWNNDPKLRPSFTQLAMFFEGIVSQDYYMEV